MRPPFELNRINVLRMMSMLSRDNRNSTVFPATLIDTIKGGKEKIAGVMEELVSIGLLAREQVESEELGSAFINHYGNTAYILTSSNFFDMEEVELLKQGIKSEEAKNFDISEIAYSVLLEMDEDNYHALFCLTRIKRKRGIFDSKLINSAIKKAKKQKANEDVLKVMNEELKLILSSLQNNGGSPQLAFDEKGKYNFQIEYTDNRTSTAKLEGSNIILKISRLMPEEEQINAIDSLKRRVLDKIEQGVIVEEEKKELKDFKDGDQIKVGEEEYHIKLFFEDKKSSSAWLDGNTIRLNISGNLSEEQKRIHINDLLRLVISKHRLPKLKKIIDELNKEHFNVEVNSVRFKNQMARWGSCSSNKNINVSYRLLFAPEDILKYVCLHELAHLIEPNHSEKFWNLVEKAIPDYKEKIEWLKKHGEGLGI